MRINLEVGGVLATKEGEMAAPVGQIWLSKHKGPFYLNGELVKSAVIPVLIGHRGVGAGKERGENSIASAKACQALQAMAEIDVQLTKDRDVVVFHDLHVGGVKIEEMPTAELRKSGVVLLSELLQETTLDLNVEIKYEAQSIPAAEWCERVLAVVEASPAERDVVYSSFSKEICAELQKRKKHTLFITEFLSEEAIEFAAALRCMGVVTDAAEALAKPLLVAAAKCRLMHMLTYGAANGKIEHVSMQRMYGVDGIITDEIETLSKFI